MELDVERLGRTLFCHGSPRSDDEAITAVTPEHRLQQLLGGVEARVVVCGHTHVQFDRRLGEQRVVNAGSVGMPYEGRPGAHWLLLGDADDYALEGEFEDVAAVVPDRLQELQVPTLYSKAAKPRRLGAAGEAVRAALPECRVIVMRGQRHAAMGHRHRAVHSRGAELSGSDLGGG